MRQAIVHREGRPSLSFIALLFVLVFLLSVAMLPGSECQGASPLGSIGVYGSGIWLLDYPGTGSWAGCGAPSDTTRDTCFYGFGWESDDIPVVGDWNGDGRAKIGVYRNGSWYLDYPGKGSWVGCGAPADPTKDACFYGFGWESDDIPVVGDWNGNGKAKVGIYRSGAWYLDYPGTGSWTGCGAPSDTTKDACFYNFGWESDDVPVVGDWNGSGTTKIGIYRSGSWYLDYPGTGSWTGCGAPTDTTKDACFYGFGWSSTDVPVVGDWNGSGKAKIGIYRSGSWYLDYPGTGSWTGCGAPSNAAMDACFSFGWTGAVPVVGNWSGLSAGSSGVSLVSIAVTPANQSLSVGSYMQFMATGTYSDGSTRNLTPSVTWASSMTSVATVGNVSGSKGLASSVAAGTTLISAVSGNISGITTLTVTQVTLKSIAVTPANASIAVGATKQFTATGTYTDGSTKDVTASVTWSSSVASVATISNASGSTGLATSVAAGTTTIYAALGSISGSSVLTVSKATLVSIAVTPTNPSVVVGTSQQFTATGTFSDNATQDVTASVTWSSATSIATISNAAGSNGKATSVSPGITTITATSGNISASTNLTITQAALVSIAVTPANPSIATGFYEQFTATGSYSDGSTQDLTSSATWSSSSPSVATIAGTSGKATSVSPGSATITATLGSMSGSTTLTVSSAKLVSISISPTTQYNLNVGAVYQFKATGTFSDNSTQDLTSSVTWSSSSSSVATVSNTTGSAGSVTAIATGTTTITATYVTVSSSTSLTVIASSSVSLQGVSISPQSPSIGVGYTQQFTATGLYSDGSTQDLTSKVVWNSTSTSVATISNATGSKGLATAVATGTTSIQCGYGAPYSSISGSSSNQDSVNMTVTQLPSNTFSVGANPTGIAVDASGDVWLSNFGGSSVTELVSSGSSSMIGNTFTSGSNGGGSIGATPFGIAIDYAGDILLTNYSAGTVTLVNLNEPAYNATSCISAPTSGVSGRVFWFVSGFTGPRGIAIDSAIAPSYIRGADPTYTYNVWVANYGSNTVAKFSVTLSICVANAINPASFVFEPVTDNVFTVGNNPYGIAIDSYSHVWVSNYGSNTVTELSSGGSVLKSGISVGTGPMGIAIDPSGNVWVANSGSNTVSKLDSNGNLLGTFQVGTGPHNIAIESTGNVWVTNFGNATSQGNTVSVLNPSGTLVNTFTVGKNPEGIAIDFSGNVWVTNYYDSTVTLLKGKTTGSHYVPYSGPIWP